MCQIYNIQVSATNDLLSIEKRSDKKESYNPLTVDCDCTVSGTCRSFGDRWEKDCITYECQRGQGNTWKAAFVKLECKDAYGHCRHNNEYMSVLNHGELFHHCLCKVTSFGISINCAQQTGNVNVS
ncbi:Hypothetical predicted protein [Mytilus galloprovincialis]|uniref:Uncharacterized protein n=1 Tax=Mytilus galloprovincialis TaxID=29158 RepID=A0A8B6CBJ1_MYTGA|nr:Hypothetical predicted protein [Mytilus galloprovincialis]